MVILVLGLVNQAVVQVCSVDLWWILVLSSVDLQSVVLQLVVLVCLDLWSAVGLHHVQVVATTFGLGLHGHFRTVPVLMGVDHVHHHPRQVHFLVNF